MKKEFIKQIETDVDPINFLKDISEIKFKINHIIITLNKLMEIHQK